MLCCVATVTLTQPSSTQAEPGSSLTLDCVVSGYNINAHHLNWIRQGPGKILVWLAAFRTGYTISIVDEFKGRVTPSTSGSAGFTMVSWSRAQAEKGPRPAPLALSPMTRLAPHAHRLLLLACPPAGRGLLYAPWPHLLLLSSPWPDPRAPLAPGLWGPACLPRTEPPGTGAEAWPVSGGGGTMRRAWLGPSRQVRLEGP
ncbi:unnamed protein product, partial [Natator depressus]